MKNPSEARSTNNTEKNGPQQGNSNCRNNSSSSSNNKTLGGLLRYFEGMRIGIELKTGRIFLGILASAEADMTVVLEDATIAAPSLRFPAAAAGARSSNNSTSSSKSRGDTNNASSEGPVAGAHQQSSKTASPSSSDVVSFPMLHIRGSKIRYIHFVDESLMRTTGANSNSNNHHPLAAVVKRGMERERSAAQKYRRGIRK
jgi:small nuclear ribonucleoprotein (snRNP)-like protein